MKYLYFLLMIGSLSFPLLFTIIRLDLIKRWKAFLLSTSIVALIFIIWDVIFTQNGVWGFNPTYYLGLKIFHLPIEEWMFFFIIPFCSLFIHFAVEYALPKVILNKTITIGISVVLILVTGWLFVNNLERAYTAVNYGFVFITLILGLLFGQHLLQRFYLTFILILIPFFIVNGVLTGVATPEPVVWYNNDENLSIRMLTIPVEDMGYAFTMLFGNLLIFERLKEKPAV